MQEYDVKRGHSKDLEGLRGIVSEIFGNAEVDDGKVVASYGAIARLTVAPKGKKAILIDTEMNKDVDNDTAAETIRAYNRFLSEATGFSSKERKQRLNKKAKEGKL